MKQFVIPPTDTQLQILQKLTLFIQSNHGLLGEPFSKIVQNFLWQFPFSKNSKSPKYHEIATVIHW